MDGFILYRVRENGSPAPPMSTFEEYCTRKEMWGARDGAVVRALASHQCGPGSNPGVDAICGLSLLLVLSLALRGFSPGTPVFPSPQKPTFPNSNSTRNQVDEEPLCGCATSKSLLLFFFYGTHRNQSTFYLDDEERKSRGSRRLKYSSSDKDHHEDEKDAAAAFDLDGDDDDSDDDGCDDNYDDESEEEEEGSERQPKGKLSN